MYKSKYVWVFVVFFVLLCCCGKIAKHNNILSSEVDVVSNIIDHSVSIVVSSPYGEDTIGSGVLVKHPSKGYAVLTAEHVALFEEDIPVKFSACPFRSGGECFSLGTNFLMDRDSSVGTDWAVFWVESLPVGMIPAPLKMDMPSIGEPIILSSIPLARVPWVSHGHVAWIWTESDYPVIGIDGFAYFGSSGGGVYDSQGFLLGLLCAIEASEWGPLEDKLLVVPIQNVKI